jgi:DNA (cytosine-5)-methyltransferase 1
MLTIGSLFAGIGGLEKGLEMAGLGPVLWQIEKDEFCRRVLAKHWPDVERYEDVRSIRASQLRTVDIICGGFPCQDVSSAGTRKGLTGGRSGLWWEFARIVKEAKPRFVVVENVASGAGRWLCAVRRHLHQLGYRTRAMGIAAADVGAPHERKRIFIIAYADSDSERARAKHAEVATASQPMANALQSRRSRPRAGAHEVWAGLGDHGGWTSEPDICRVAYGVSGGMDGRKRRARLRALGNAVVPQCAEVVGQVIRQMLEAA